MVDLSALDDPRTPPGFAPWRNVPACDPARAAGQALALAGSGYCFLLRPGLLLPDRRRKAGCRVVPCGHTVYRRKKRGGVTCARWSSS